jgi:hypothetical protein
MANKCWKCARPVFFVRIWNGGTDEPGIKPLPLNVDPDNDRGSIALTDWPAGFHQYKPPGMKFYKVGRRIYAEAARTYVRLGGALYRVHYETCQKS